MALTMNHKSCGGKKNWLRDGLVLGKVSFAIFDNVSFNIMTPQLTELN